MNLEETRNKILTDNQFVIDECRRIQTLYEMKKVIRYSMSREESVDTESVAEHVYAMHALSAYFLPFEDPDNKLDHYRIHSLAEFHDIDEIETGDFVSHWKTAEQIAAGKAALPNVIKRLPESMQPAVTDLLDEYEAQETMESKFVKAIDKIEPSFHLYNENGRVINHEITYTTYDKHRQIREPYTHFFPIIHRFSEVLNDVLRTEGFFVEDDA